WAAPTPCRRRCCAGPSGSGACHASRCHTSWRASCCTSSCIARTRSVAGSRIIADPELTAADRAALLGLARATLVAHLVGLLLPQVAAEYHWGPETFLAAGCRKAGLAPDAWREAGTEVVTFQADVFGETGAAGRGRGEA